MERRDLKISCAGRVFAAVKQGTGSEEPSGTLESPLPRVWAAPKRMKGYHSRDEVTSYGKGEEILQM